MKSHRGMNAKVYLRNCEKFSIAGAETQFSSVPQSCLTLWDPMDCSTPGSPSPTSTNLLKLKSIKSMMPSNHLILCHPLLFLPLVFPSIISFFMAALFHSDLPHCSNFSGVTHAGLKNDWFYGFYLRICQGFTFAEAVKQWPNSS